MSTSGNHYYRFTYLKSEHWQNLRIEKLTQVDAHCVFCWNRDLRHDVHHIVYKRLWDAKPHDLVVLCRHCHDLAHAALRYRKQLKDERDPDKKWAATRASMGIAKSHLQAIEAQRRKKNVLAYLRTMFPSMPKSGGKRRSLVRFREQNPNATREEWIIAFPGLSR